MRERERERERFVRLGATVTLACRNPSNCNLAAVNIRQDSAANDNTMVVENKNKKDNKSVGTVRTMTGPKKCTEILYRLLPATSTK